MIDLTDDESKRGALDALKVLLASKVSPLRVEGEENELKMPKNVQQIEDDVEDEEAEENDSQDDGNENQEENSSDSSDEDPQDQKGPDRLDALDKNNTENETQEDRAERIRNELLDDADEILADIKKDTETRKVKAAQKAHADELARLKQKAKAKADNTILNIADFEQDLVKAIKDQLKMARNAEDTYQKPNATYAGTRYVMPGQKVFEKKQKPVINIYFDVSGSISDEALDRAVRALSQLDLLVKKKLVDFKIYYFADNVTPNRNEAAGCTGAFPEILAHLKATRANNAIIITDDDFDRQSDWDRCSLVTLKGCIW